jgi:hypothetical protein
LRNERTKIDIAVEALAVHCPPERGSKGKQAEQQQKHAVAVLPTHIVQTTTMAAGRGRTSQRVPMTRRQKHAAAAAIARTMPWPNRYLKTDHDTPTQWETP